MLYQITIYGRSLLGAKKASNCHSCETAPDTLDPGCWYAHLYSRRSFVNHSWIIPRSIRCARIPIEVSSESGILDARHSASLVGRTSLTANSTSGCFGMRPSRRLEKVIDLVANMLSPRLLGVIGS